MGRSKFSRPGWNRQKFYVRNVGPFGVNDLIYRAVTVTTRDGDCYVNLQNGHFIRQATGDHMVTAAQMYGWVKEAFDANGRLIAQATRKYEKYDDRPLPLRRVRLEPKANKGVI